MEKRIELEKRGRNPGDVRQLSDLFHPAVCLFACLLIARLESLSLVPRLPPLPLLLGTSPLGKLEFAFSIGWISVHILRARGS